RPEIPKPDACWRRRSRTRSTSPARRPVSKATAEQYTAQSPAESAPLLKSSLVRGDSGWEEKKSKVKRQKSKVLPPGKCAFAQFRSRWHTDACFAESTLSVF